jgi:arylformamidase
MKIHDISMTLRPGMAVWPGDLPFERTIHTAITNGSDSNTSSLSLSSHCGTHVDAPLHFLPGGAGIDQLDMHKIAGPARVLDCTGRSVVDTSDLKGKLPAGVIPLLKTDSSSLPENAPFRDDYVCLTEGAARVVAESGVPAIGVDYLSVGGLQNGTEVHRILLKAGVLAIEGLRLADVSPGDFTLVCLPLKVAGGDGAPARAVLIEGSADKAGNFGG